MTYIEPGYGGPFPDGTQALAREATVFLEATSDPASHDRPTICELWTVLDLVRHLAATFQRFNERLDRSREGDFSKPFEPDDLGEENLRAVASFEGEPRARFRSEVLGFLERCGDPAEPMAHQRDVIPVGLQVLFGLADVTIHHWDLTLAIVAEPYRPGDDVPGLLVPALRALGAPAPEGDTWRWALLVSGREP